jgi:hypothetical protein
LIVFLCLSQFGALLIAFGSPHHSRPKWPERFDIHFAGVPHDQTCAIIARLIAGRSSTESVGRACAWRCCFGLG